MTPRLVQFPTFDRVDGRQRQEPVYVYQPATPGQHPVLILLHGGPEAQFRPGFDPWLQYVVNELGYAVLAPNVRGSSGYGKSYLALDNGVLREDAVKDVGALLVWLGLQNDFDPKHVVVSGSSYGGYLALATLVDFGGASARRRRCGRHHRLREFFDQYGAVSSEPAPRRIRRRARSRHADFSAARVAADECRTHY